MGVTWVGVSWVGVSWVGVNCVGVNCVGVSSEALYHTDSCYNQGLHQTVPVPVAHSLVLTHLHLGRLSDAYIKKCHDISLWVQ